MALTSEAAAEPYMDSFDAFLTWFGHRPEDVPLLPAIYSGYALYFLYGELLGEVIPVGEVPLVDIKWDRDKVGEFKVPAVFGTVWRNRGGERRAFIVNITGEEQQFTGRLAKDGKPFTVTIPPRSLVVR